MAVHSDVQALLGVTCVCVCVCVCVAGGCAATYQLSNQRAGVSLGHVFQKDPSLL